MPGQRTASRKTRYIRDAIHVLTGAMAAYYFTVNGEQPVLTGVECNLPPINFNDYVAAHPGTSTSTCQYDTFWMLLKYGFYGTTALTIVAGTYAYRKFPFTSEQMEAFLNKVTAMNAGRPEQMAPLLAAMNGATSPVPAPVPEDMTMSETAERIKNDADQIRTRDNTPQEKIDAYKELLSKLDRKIPSEDYVHVLILGRIFGAKEKEKAEEKRTLAEQFLTAHEGLTAGWKAKVAKTYNSVNTYLHPELKEVKQEETAQTAPSAAAPQPTMPFQDAAAELQATIQNPAARVFAEQMFARPDFMRTICDNPMIRSQMEARGFSAQVMAQLSDPAVLASMEKEFKKFTTDGPTP